MTLALLKESSTGGRRIGSLVHEYLAAHYLDRPPKQEDLEKVAGSQPKLITVAREIFEGWRRVYGAKDPWDPVAVEIEIVATLANIVPDYREYAPDPTPAGLGEEIVTSRLDLVFRHKWGRRKGLLDACDHKTKALRGKTFPKWANASNEYTSDWQFILQLKLARWHFAKVIGERVHSVWVQRIGNNAPVYDRNVVQIPKDAYQAADIMLVRAILAERDLWARLDDGEKPLPTGLLTGHCIGRYGACDYRPLCVASAGQRSLVRDENYETVPLLGSGSGASRRGTHRLKAVSQCERYAWMKYYEG